MNTSAGNTLIIIKKNNNGKKEYQTEIPYGETLSSIDNILNVAENLKKIDEIDSFIPQRMSADSCRTTDISAAGYARSLP
jgi:hypothetical protein